MDSTCAAALIGSVAFSTVSSDWLRSDMDWLMDSPAASIEVVSTTITTINLPGVVCRNAFPRRPIAIGPCKKRARSRRGSSSSSHASALVSSSPAAEAVARITIPQ